MVCFTNGEYAKNTDAQKRASRIQIMEPPNASNSTSALEKRKARNPHQYACEQIIYRLCTLRGRRGGGGGGGEDEEHGSGGGGGGRGGGGGAKAGGGREGGGGSATLSSSTDKRKRGEIGARSNGGKRGKDETEKWGNGGKMKRG